MPCVIKICGLTTPHLAEYCINAGAHYIGVVICERSKRFVDIKTAKHIAEATKLAGGIPVAVFTDHKAETILQVCEQTGIDHVQLHGPLSHEALVDLPESIRVIYATIPGQALITQNIEFQLFDGTHPGSGQTIDWSSLKVPEGQRFFLAGGLNPDNIAQALKQVRPHGVDVSSGVESSPGKKCKRLIKKFIKKTREVEYV